MLYLLQDEQKAGRKGEEQVFDKQGFIGLGLLCLGDLGLLATTHDTNYILQYSHEKTTPASTESQQQQQQQQQQLLQHAEAAVARSNHDNNDDTDNNE